MNFSWMFLFCLTIKPSVSARTFNSICKIHMNPISFPSHCHCWNLNSGLDHCFWPSGFWVTQMTFTNGYQIMSSLYLKSFSGFPEHAYKPCFINTAHKAYLIPQWSYLMPVGFIHSHIHLTDLASYIFSIMKTMKWYDLKKICYKNIFQMLLRYKHGHTYCDEHLISYIFACMNKCACRCTHTQFSSYEFLTLLSYKQKHSFFWLGKFLR